MYVTPWLRSLKSTLDSCRLRRARRTRRRHPAQRLCAPAPYVEMLEDRTLLSQVTTLAPAANSHTAPVDTNVTATFDANIDNSSVTDQTFVVHSMQRGQLVGAAVTSVGASAATVTLNPARNFFPGELVQATATARIKAPGTSVEPHVWQFRTKVTVESGGIFVDIPQSLGSSWSHGVSLGDLDGDGDLDAFVANVSGQANRVWLNDGKGTFTSGQTLGNSSSFGAALGDMDGDGDLDAFVANKGANIVWLNNGDGTFTRGDDTLGGSSSRNVSLGDLDGDGDLDAFVANDSSQANEVWLNDGTGTFMLGDTVGTVSSLDVSLGDLDGDGDLDAFVANGGANNRVWSNDGTGNFTLAAALPGSLTSEGVSLGDLDGDGDLDAFVANSGAGNNANRVWRNDGNGNFTVWQKVGSSNSNSLSLGDVDGDGDLDAFVTNGSSGRPESNRVWLNDGNGTFSDSGQTLGKDRSYGVSLADVDGDGDLDAFVANGKNNQPNRVWLNIGFDWGDAPTAAQSGFAASFPTTLADNGARHRDAGPTLGASRDLENDGQPTTGANGDDTIGSADENGLVSRTALAPGRNGAFIINVEGVTDTHYVNAWIDFNADGDWSDTGEQITTDFQIIADGDHRIEFPVPDSAVLGNTYARFRLSSTAGLSFTGLADDGEVEDYLVTIAVPPSSPVFAAFTPDDPLNPTASRGVLTVVVLEEDGDVAITNGSVLVNGDPVPVDAADTLLGNVQPDQVRELVITGDDGFNTIDLSGVTAAAGFVEPISIFVDGRAGADSILGSEFADILSGGDDEDTIEGGEGDDELFGEKGADVINGQNGNDTIKGGPGNDVLDGGDDDDSILGNSGRDVLGGGDGADTMLGNSGRDTLSGDDGNDSLLGNNGEDQLFGGAGSDTLLGGNNNDLLNGGADNDTLQGEANDDVLIGGGGADSLLGGAGDDQLRSVFSAGEDQTAITRETFDAATGLPPGPGAVNRVEDDPLDASSEFDPAVAIDPTVTDNPTLFAIMQSTGGFFRAGFSTDGGVNWADSTTPPPLSAFPAAAWDTFDNLFVAGVDSNGDVFVSISTNDGVDFFPANTVTLGPGTTPAIAVGPGRPLELGGVDLDGDGVSDEQALWVVWENNDAIAFAGFSVTGTGAVTLAQQGDIVGTTSGAFPDVAVGPAGSVAAAYQQRGDDDEGPTFINVVVNVPGLADAGGNGWATPQPVRHPADATAPTTNVGVDDVIPAQPAGINAQPHVVWDHSGGRFDGRLYLVYTTEASDSTAATLTSENETVNNNTDVVLLTTDNLEDLVVNPDDPGFNNEPDVSWPAPLVVTDDPLCTADEQQEQRSQFLPQLALDQTTGILAVTWYDARNDVGNSSEPGNTNDPTGNEIGNVDSANDDVQVFGTLSFDGGQSSRAPFRLSDFGYGDAVSGVGENQFPSRAGVLMETQSWMIDAGTNDGGSFTLNFGGFGDTATITYSTTLTAATVESAILSVPGTPVTPGDISVGGADGGPFFIQTTQTGQFANTRLTTTADLSGLTGGGGQVFADLSLSELTFGDYMGLDFYNGRLQPIWAENANTGAGDDDDSLLTTLQIRTTQLLIAHEGDTLEGGSGADTLEGDQGNDSLTGDADADSLLGGPGEDTLDGGTEADTLDGGGGADLLKGGSGDDLIQSGVFPTELPELAIENARLDPEGNGGTVELTFTVTLSQPSETTVKVSFATADNTALGGADQSTPGADFVITSGQLTFEPGITSQTISVPVIGDTVDEPTENFFVNLTNPLGADISNDQGAGWIVDDDEPVVEIDVFLLFDDTGTFFPALPALQNAFPLVISNLTAGLPDASLAFGIGRFDGYTGLDAPLNRNETNAYSLNQPIILVNDPQFDAAMTAAFLPSRRSPANGLPDPLDEAAIEGLFQVATGTGFDGNGNGNTTDSGPAGFVSTQIAPGVVSGGDPLSHDIPPFDPLTFTGDFNGEDLNGDGLFNDGIANPLLDEAADAVDYNNDGDMTDTLSEDLNINSRGIPAPDGVFDQGPVLPAAGTIGGVGFRPNAIKLVLLATDAAFTYVPDGATQYFGVAGPEPAGEVQFGGGTNAPANGAQIQPTIDALIAEGIQVIGLGGSSPPFGVDATDPTRFPRRNLQAVSRLTGAVNTTTGSLDSGIAGDQIDLGEALYFFIDPDAGDTIANAIITAVTAAAQNLPTVSISDARINPETDGIRDATFTVTLSRTTGADVTITYSTIDGSATGGASANTSGVDYIAQSSATTTIPAGATSGTISVTIVGDTTDEFNENFFVQLESATGGVDISIDLGEGFIIDDDGPGDPVGDTLNGDAGSDTLVGNEGDDCLGGGTEADTLLGGLGNDTLNGDAGGDELFAGSGNDKLDGGADADTLEGGAGNDTLSGGAGADSVFGDVDPNDTDFNAAVHFGTDLIIWKGGDAAEIDDGDDSIDGGASFDRLLVDLNDAVNSIDADGTTSPGKVSVIDNAGGGSTATAELVEHLDFKMGGGADFLDINDFSTEPSVLLITADGEDGADSIDGAGNTDADLLLFVQGGDGKDTLTGGVGDDTLEGGNNADTMDGGAGDDMLRGGDSDPFTAITDADSLVGGTGDDTLLGEGGADTMDGGAGRDLMNGGEGADTIEGGADEDTLLGGDGADSLGGSGGDDVMDGGDSNDTLFGGADNDNMQGGAGKDTLAGDAGDDTLFGNAGSDSLVGGSENDLIRGQEGRDTIEGGTGADTLQGGDHRDSIRGEDGTDFIQGGRGKDTLSGNAAADTIFGGRGSDSIMGDGGNDILSGQGGRDTIWGDDVAGAETGNDILNGMGGKDSLIGGLGDDRISGRQGDDTIDGGAGADILVGGDGDDTIQGGATDAAADTILGNDGDDSLTGDSGADTISTGDGDDATPGYAGTDAPALDNTINASTAGFEWIDNIMSFLDLI